MNSEEMTRRLSEPFEVREVKFKPQSVNGNRAMAVAYIDCRVVQDRLDGVMGAGGWMDDYEILNDGSVVCRLKLNLESEWVTKTDVGSPSQQPDGGDRLKAAFSDALKRAAVKFGIGRYIYRLPFQWVDYDPQKKQFSAQPRLPDWALPKGKATGQQQAAPAASPPRPAGPANSSPRTVERIITDIAAVNSLPALEEVGSRIAQAGDLNETDKVALRSAYQAKKVKLSNRNQ